MMHIFRIILYLFIFVSCSLFPAYGVCDSILAPKWYVRFAPLAGMMEAYTMMGDTLRADSMARVIISKKVKVPSVEVQDPESKEGYLMQF